MAKYTVRKGKWYIARISLSGFNRFATNHMVAAKLEDVVSQTSRSRDQEGSGSP